MGFFDGIGAGEVLGLGLGGAGAVSSLVADKSRKKKLAQLRQQMLNAADTGASAIDVTNQALDGSVSPAATGTWFDSVSGAQPPVRTRAGGSCVQVVLRQNSANESFAVERIVTRTKALGPRRF